jgi:hypothetical protein
MGGLFCGMLFASFAGANMRKYLIGLALVLFAGSAAAQEQVETVVVTSSRIGYDGDAPNVTLPQRADHLITKVRVVCDTRDLDKRKEELRQTLRGMIGEAKGTSSISLSVGDELLIDFTEKMLDKVIVPDSKADTSDAYVVIRTELSKDDTFDGATQRIKDFVAKTSKAGRTEVLIDEKFNLGLVKPERYRAELIAKIAADTKQIAQTFGADYNPRVEGLQRPIQWYQSGPLDLALYIPYGVVIAPHGTP